MKIVAVLYPGGEIARKTPALLGCAENALGLTNFLESQGHEFVVLTDKEVELDKHLATADILITTPFWPAYVTKERISKAPKLSSFLQQELVLIISTWRLQLHAKLWWLRLPVVMS